MKIILIIAGVVVIIILVSVELILGGICQTFHIHFRDNLSLSFIDNALSLAHKAAQHFLLKALIIYFSVPHHHGGGGGDSNNNKVGDNLFLILGSLL